MLCYGCGRAFKQIDGMLQLNCEDAAERSELIYLRWEERGYE